MEIWNKNRRFAPKFWIMNEILKQMEDYLSHASHDQLEADKEYLEKFNFGPLVEEVVPESLSAKEVIQQSTVTSMF